MACINPDGTLTESAQKVLACLQNPTSDADVAALVGLPIYRVRSSLRELVQAGLVTESASLYAITNAGRAKL